MSKARKKQKKLVLSSNEASIVELQSNLDKRLFVGNDLITARSLLSYYVAGIELSFKQRELTRLLNAKLKIRKAVTESSKKYNLYAITNGVDVKLGISSNIGKRIRSMQTGNSSELKLIWKYYVGKDKTLAFRKERKLHRLCKKYKLKGEWFDSECMELVESFRV